MTWLETPGGVAAALNRYDQHYKGEVARMGPVEEILAKEAQRVYQDGLADGMEIALKLMLGRESPGGVPYTGSLPPGARHYAISSLERIAKAREEMNG